MMKVVVHVACGNRGERNAVSPGRAACSQIHLHMPGVASGGAHLVVLVRRRRLTADVRKAADLGRGLCVRE